MIVFKLVLGDLVLTEKKHECEVPRRRILGRTYTYKDMYVTVEDMFWTDAQKLRAEGFGEYKWMITSILRYDEIRDAD